MSSIRISQEVETNLSRLQVKINHYSKTNQLRVQSESVIGSNRINQDYKSKLIITKIRINHE